MLTIRREQIAAFEAASRTRFERNLTDYIAKRLETDGKPVDFDWIRRQMIRGIAEAPRYWLATEQDVAGFIEITCVDGEGFPEGEFPKPALAILCSYGLDSKLKLERYRTWVLSATRREKAAAASGI